MAAKNPCEGCSYFGGKTIEVRSCNYLLITGQRRPCPVGSGCIVRRDGKQKHRIATSAKTENSWISSHK